MTDATRATRALVALSAVPLVLFGAFNGYCASADSCRNFTSDTGVIPGPGWISFLSLPFLLAIVLAAAFVFAKHRVWLAIAVLLLAALSMICALVVMS